MCRPSTPCARIDREYILSLELDDSRFDASVLLKARSKQRTDSTHALTAETEAEIAVAPATATEHPSALPAIAAPIPVTVLPPDAGIPGPGTRHQSPPNNRW